MFYFLVYNDESHTEYLDQLVKSVNTYGANFEIIIFHKSAIDCHFSENNKSILDCKRGGGYWLWKPYIIMETMKKINDHDILFYMDSKYCFIEDFTDLYSDYMKNNDILVWKNKPNESIFYMKNWCKMDVIHKYNLFDKVFNENAEDCWGGALVLKKNNNTLNFVKEWLEMCCIYDDITDKPGELENSSLFREHRHDQSLLSAVLHKYNIELHFFECKYLQNLRCPF